MSYLKVFRGVKTFVAALDVEVTFKRGRPLTAERVIELCSQSAIPVPASVAELYLECGDGLRFSWSRDEEPDSPYASLHFPPLAELVIPSLQSLNWRMEWEDTYDFRYTDDPVQAKQTALRMRRWLPLLEESNGDSKCVDTAIDPAPVVFNKHDWFDGGTGENGRVLGGSLLEFLTAWAKVCFQEPSGNWWPGVFHPSGGVDWSSAEFRDPFRMKIEE